MSAQIGNEIFKIASTGSDDRKLKFLIGKPNFLHLKITSAPKIGAIRCQFLIIDTLGSTEPDGIVRGELLGSVSVKYCMLHMGRIKTNVGRRYSLCRTAYEWNS